MHRKPGRGQRREGRRKRETVRGPHGAAVLLNPVCALPSPSCRRRTFWQQGKAWSGARHLGSRFGSPAAKQRAGPIWCRASSWVPSFCCPCTGSRSCGGEARAVYSSPLGGQCSVTSAVTRAPSSLSHDAAFQHLVLILHPSRELTARGPSPFTPPPSGSGKFYAAFINVASDRLVSRPEAMAACCPAEMGCASGSDASKNLEEMALQALRPPS